MSNMRLTKKMRVSIWYGREENPVIVKLRAKSIIDAYRKSDEGKPITKIIVEVEDE